MGHGLDLREIGSYTSFIEYLIYFSFLAQVTIYSSILSYCHIFENTFKFLLGFLIFLLLLGLVLGLSDRIFFGVTA